LQHWEIPKLTHLRVSPRKGNGPHKGRETLARVEFEPTTFGFNHLSYKAQNWSRLCVLEMLFHSIEASN